jgi:hypothetical protein
MSPPELIPALFPDSLQDACLARVFRDLLECGKRVERAATKEVAVRGGGGSSSGGRRRRRGSSVVLSPDLMHQLGSTAATLLDEAPVTTEPDTFTESITFLQAAAKCRAHLIAQISSSLVNVLLAEALSQPFATPGQMFAFAVLVNERTTRFSAYKRLHKEDQEVAEDNQTELAQEDPWKCFLEGGPGSDLLLQCLTTANALSTLVIHEVCTNELLHILAKSCPRLQSLDISYSWAVTDLGLVYLCGKAKAAATADVLAGDVCYLRELYFNPRCLDGQDQPVAPRVVAGLLKHFPLLDVLDLPGLHAGILHYLGLGSGLSGGCDRRRRPPPLRLRHYTGSDELSADVASACPKLRTFKLSVTRALPKLGQILAAMTNSLESVTLVFPTSADSLEGVGEFVAACGQKIYRLEINCSPRTPVSVNDLEAIATHCVFLDALCFSSLTYVDPNQPHEPAFAFLAGPAPTPLPFPFLTELSASSVSASAGGRHLVRRLLGGCPELERLCLRFSRRHPPAAFFSDFLLDEVMTVNPLARLETLALDRVGLTLISALRLISTRPKLRALGALSAWDVEEGELSTFAGILRRANGLGLLQHISIF